ncbi:hypothetical protein [Thermoleptolyngbya sp. C42_A2020_037]|nr:hypothetical protein [Thermoleptolyngbya sp. C42_A2020_037]
MGDEPNLTLWNLTLWNLTLWKGAIAKTKKPSLLNHTRNEYG